MPDASIRDVESTDLIVVSSILDIDQTMKYEGEVVDWLKQHYHLGSHIASICTGAFVLAETGLLDGKTATTHWVRWASHMIFPEFCTEGPKDARG